MNINFTLVSHIYVQVFLLYYLQKIPNDIVQTKEFSNIDYIHMLNALRLLLLLLTLNIVSITCGVASGDPEISTIKVVGDVVYAVTNKFLTVVNISAPKTSKPLTIELPNEAEGMIIDGNTLLVITKVRSQEQVKVSELEEYYGAYGQRSTGLKITTFFMYRNSVFVVAYDIKDPMQPRDLKLDTLNTKGEFWKVKLIKGYAHVFTTRKILDPTSPNQRELAHPTSLNIMTINMQNPSQVGHKYFLVEEPKYLYAGNFSMFLVSEAVPSKPDSPNVSTTIYRIRTQKNGKDILITSSGGSIKFEGELPNSDSIAEYSTQQSGIEIDIASTIYDADRGGYRVDLLFLDNQLMLLWIKNEVFPISSSPCQTRIQHGKVVQGGCQVLRVYDIVTDTTKIYENLGDSRMAIMFDQDTIFSLTRKGTNNELSMYTIDLNATTVRAKSIVSFNSSEVRSMAQFYSNRLYREGSYLLIPMFRFPTRTSNNKITPTNGVLMVSVGANKKIKGQVFVHYEKESDQSSRLFRLLRTSDWNFKAEKNQRVIVLGSRVFVKSQCTFRTFLINDPQKVDAFKIECSSDVRILEATPPSPVKKSG